MKLSTITFLFSAAMVPFAAVSATIFKCGATADFRGKDKAKNPTVPSKAMLNWMSDDLMQTFTSSYRSNEDLNMISDVFDKFTMKRETAADLSDEDGDITLSANGRSGSYLDALAAKLRGTENVGRKWYNWYYYWYRTNTKIQCNYCGHPDDDYRLGETNKKIEEVLMETEEHKLWEATFCSSLQATDEFSTANKCQIVLHDCAAETPEDSSVATEVTADNYIVSDNRNVLKDDEEGVVFTLETVEYHVAEESLLSE